MGASRVKGGRGALSRCSVTIDASDVRFGEGDMAHIRNHRLSACKAERYKLIYHETCQQIVCFQSIQE